MHSLSTIWAWIQTDLLHLVTSYLVSLSTLSWSPPLPPPPSLPRGSAVCAKDSIQYGLDV